MSILLLALIGFAVATVGTVVGAGGGFLLVPILIFLYPETTPAAITFVSLFTAMTNGVSATIGYARLRRTDYRSGLIFGACMAPMAVVGVLTVRHVQLGFFTAAFGVLLVLVAAQLVWRVLTSSTGRPPAAEPKPHWTRRSLTDADGIRFEYAFNMPLGMGLSGLVGFISSFFGVGGGVMQVPIMTQILRFPIRVATATSILVLLISTSVGVSTHLAVGKLDVPLKMALTVGAGAILGGQVGSRLARYVRGRTILLILGAALLLVGIRLVLRVM